MPQPITKPCGTYAAARRHQRRGEPLCQPCTDARRAWWRERAQIAYSMPAFRARENARTAARLARRRAEDSIWRERANKARRARRRAEKQASCVLVDPVVVERLITGEPVTASSRERNEAVRVLDARGFTHTQIATRLRMSGKRVVDVLGRSSVRPPKHPACMSCDARQEATG